MVVVTAATAAFLTVGVVSPDTVGIASAAVGPCTATVHNPDGTSQDFTTPAGQEDRSLTLGAVKHNPALGNVFVFSATAFVETEDPESGALLDAGCHVTTANSPATQSAAAPAQPA